jgi:hypothetical protein
MRKSRKAEQNSNVSLLRLFAYNHLFSSEIGNIDFAHLNALRSEIDTFLKEFMGNIENASQLAAAIRASGHSEVGEDSEGPGGSFLGMLAAVEASVLEAERFVTFLTTYINVLIALADSSVKYCELVSDSMEAAGLEL